MLLKEAPRQLLGGFYNICEFQDDKTTRRTRASAKECLMMTALIRNVLISITGNISELI